MIRKRINRRFIQATGRYSQLRNADGRTIDKVDGLVAVLTPIVLAIDEVERTLIGRMSLSSRPINIGTHGRAGPGEEPVSQAGLWRLH